MLVYCHSITPRIQYVAGFISNYFSHSFHLTANEQAFMASTEEKINYSYQQICREEVFIKPNPLLTEYEKRKFEIHTFQHNHYTAFFKTEGDMEFDLFAGIFYLLSRYEEYLHHHGKVAHSSFSYKDSIAFKEEFLSLPLVNIWLEDFRLFLEQKFPDIELKKDSFRFLPTYNISTAWRYLHKGFNKSAIEIFSAIFNGQWKKASEHIKVLRGKMQDPFDAFEWMQQVNETYNLHPIYFFLLAAEGTKQDTNTSIQIPQFQQLIKWVSEKNKMGLHPSCASGDAPPLLHHEKRFLEGLTDQTITASRQHMGRMTLPRTFHQLIEAGIKEEYSMGYNDINGFRASVATPFYFYDLDMEEQTSLLVYPFCFMDAATLHQKNNTPEKAFEELMGFYNIIKEVNGTMVTVWHNTFLGAAEEMSEWKTAYENFLKSIGQPRA